MNLKKIPVSAALTTLLITNYHMYQGLSQNSAIGIGLLLTIGMCCLFQKKWQWGICLLIWTLSSWHGWQDSQFQIDTPGHYTGTLQIASAPEKTKSGAWTFQAYDTNSEKKYHVHLREKTPPKIGSYLSAAGQIGHGKISRNPGGYTPINYLKQEKLSGFLSITDSKIQGRNRWSPKIWLTDIRDHSMKSTQAALPKNYANLLIGLILGDKGISLNAEWESWYRDLGLIHILVVSGSQVSLLSGIFFLLLRPLRLSGSRQYMIMTGINLSFYILTGGGASIFRAIVMNQILLYIKTIRQHSTPIDMLCLTALLMLLWDPSLATNLGAQLSFLATSALLFGVPALEKQMPRVPEWARTPIALSLAPFIVTTPLIWHHFQLLSPLSPLANLTILPLIEVLVPIGFFCMAFQAIVPSLMALPMQGCLGLMQLLNTIVEGLISLDIRPWLLPKLSLPFMLALYVGIYLIGTRQKYLLTHVGLVLSTLGIVFAIDLWPAPYHTITYLDVGQGDATIIHTKNKQTYVIDTGNRTRHFQTGEVTFDAGKSVVLPALRHYGIRKIDGLILTHFDLDHIGGAASIVQQHRVQHILTHHAPNMQKTGIARPVSIQNIISPTKITLDTDIYLLFLPFSFQKRTESENERSLVCMLVIGNQRFLFTGDLESEGETHLAATYPEYLKTTVFKAGHHGSKTSSTQKLLKEATPKIAVISAGAKNRYGHPNKEVLSRFESAGIQVYRTDQHGAIEIKTNGKNLWIKTY